MSLILCISSVNKARQILFCVVQNTKPCFFVHRKSPKSVVVLVGSAPETTAPRSWMHLFNSDAFPSVTAEFIGCSSKADLILSFESRLFQMGNNVSAHFSSGSYRVTVVTLPPELVHRICRFLPERYEEQ